MSELHLPSSGEVKIGELKPGEKLDGPRLFVCLDCSTMTRILPYMGPPEHDQDLEKCVRSHQHLEKGPHEVRFQLFQTTWATWEHLDPVEELRKQFEANGVWIQEYRSQVGEDAVACHRKHNQPEYPGKPCIDYKTDAKRLGGGLSVRVSLKLRDPAKLQYLCTYCPYESTVVTAKRWEQGAYNL